MGGVMPNIKTRDFKQRFERLLKGSKALLYVAQGHELFESGKLNRTIKKKRKGEKDAKTQTLRKKKKRFPRKSPRIKSARFAERAKPPTRRAVHSSRVTLTMSSFILKN